MKRDSVSSRLKRTLADLLSMKEKRNYQSSVPSVKTKYFCQRNIKRAQNETENLLSYDQILGNACLSSLAVDVSLISRNLSFVYMLADHPCQWFRYLFWVFTIRIQHCLIHGNLLKGMQSGDRSAA